MSRLKDFLKSISLPSPLCYSIMRWIIPTCLTCFGAEESEEAWREDPTNRDCPSQLTPLEPIPSLERIPGPRQLKSFEAIKIAEQAKAEIAWSKIISSLLFNKFINNSGVTILQDFSKTFNPMQDYLLECVFYAIETLKIKEADPLLVFLFFPMACKEWDTIRLLETLGKMEKRWADLEEEEIMPPYRPFLQVWLELIVSRKTFVKFTSNYTQELCRSELKYGFI
jgi:hypothetical protein